MFTKLSLRTLAATFVFGFALTALSNDEADTNAEHKPAAQSIFANTSKMLNCGGDHCGDHPADEAKPETDKK
jgi:uncharacterized low-complexity protein